MIEKTLRANLLAIVAAYRKATGASLAAVSRKFYGKVPFLAQSSSGTNGRRTPTGRIFGPSSLSGR
jgi:hypothetical protein